MLNYTARMQWNKKRRYEMIGITRYGRDPWSIFDELESLQEDFNRAFGDWGAPGRRSGRRRAFPPLNVWASEEGVVVDAELPGVEVNDVDIAVTGDELAIRGKVGVAEPREGETLHRRERAAGEFARTLTLPFRADGAGVKAAYKNGILRITVPRAEEDRPRKIAIEA
jgi:HSP20 family protein